MKNITLTPEWLEESRQMAEAAKKATGDWPWAWMSFGEQDYGYAVCQAMDRDENPVRGEVDEQAGHSEFEGILETCLQNGEAVCKHVSRFDPATAMALVDEVKKLRSALEGLKRSIQAGVFGIPYDEADRLIMDINEVLQPGTIA